MKIIPHNTKFIIILEFLEICHLLPFNKRKNVTTFYSYISSPLASLKIRSIFICFTGEYFQIWLFQINTGELNPHKLQ